MPHIDVISKIQHYGVPTRLLDVVTNALVALYFACDDAKNKEKDGCAYIFNPNKSDIKSFDSDVISILASLPRFNEKVKKQLLGHTEKHKINNKVNRNIDSFNKKDVVKRLLHGVKKEKPAFENIINPKDLLSNYFLLPKKDNARIIRQIGAFIICRLDKKEDIKYYKKITIPSASKNN